MAATPIVVDNLSAITAAIQNSTAAHAVQDYLDPAARTAFGIPAHEGQITALTFQDRLEVYDGATWQRLAHWSATARTGAVVTRNANQSIANATNTAITWDTEVYDGDAMIAVPSTNLTIPAGLGGMWLIGFHVSWASDPGTSVAAWIDVASGGALFTTEQGSANRPSAGGRWHIGLTAIVSLNAGHIITGNVRQSSGAAINALASLSATRVCL